MIKLKREKTKFWGIEYTITPMLLGTIIGDGAEWIWFSYMDDRPNYYVVRVPTGTLVSIQGRTDYFYDDVLPEIVNAIEDESYDFYGPRQWRERDRKGYVSSTRRWPIPPNFSSGSTWGEYEPDKETLRRAVVNTPMPDTKRSG
ncbi:MAG: hypothetical protein LBK99_16610 [Opitutaceae bacterium]|jgi:hypothetical protein|nr:hypothetical protein [Opitutaceae bacterium]